MKRTAIITGIVFVVALAVLLTGCTMGEKDATVAEIDAVNGGTVGDGTVEIVVEAGQESLDLSNKLATESDAPWSLYRDRACTEEIADKVVPGEGYSLKNGDNVYYIVVESLDGNIKATYVLTVHKQYTVTARILNAAGEQLSSETVLSHTAYKPLNETVIPTGYRLEGWISTDPAWDNDGIIRRDTDFTAVIAAKSYTVTYSLKEGESLPVGTDAAAKVTFDSEYTLAVPLNSDSGLYFVGWRSPIDDDLMLTDETGKSLAVWSRDAGLSVVAVWSDVQPPVADPVP